MRKLIKLTLMFAAIAIIFPSCVSKKKFTELLSSKEAVDATLASTQSKVKMLEGENEELMSAKAELESKNATLTSDLATANSKLEGASKELATTKTKLSATEGELATAQQNIKGVFSGYEGSGLSVTQRDNRLYVALGEPILFRSGSTRIARKYRGAIDSLAQIMIANPGMNIQVEGHSDNAKFIEGNGNNWNLSTNRALNTVNRLIKAGVSPNQLSAVGRGEFAPASSDDPNSKESRKLNRRVEFVVTPHISSLKP